MERRLQRHGQHVHGVDECESIGDSDLQCVADGECLKPYHLHGAGESRLGSLLWRVAGVLEGEQIFGPVLRRTPAIQSDLWARTALRSAAGQSRMRFRLSATE